MSWPWGELSWHPFVRARQMETISCLILAAATAVVGERVEDLGSALAAIRAFEDDIRYLVRHMDKGDI